MARRFTLGFAAAVLVAMSVGSATAAEELQVDDVDISLHPQVTITVTMPPGLAGRQLSDDAFTIIEGGQPVVPTVERLPNEDLEVVLVLDTSQSMQGAPLAEAISAAESFAAAMPGEVRIAVVTFASNPTLVTDFVAPVDVPTALAQITAAGETALYDGLVRAAELWDGAAPSRRAVVLLSDGGDTVSSGTLENAIVAMIGTGADFYAVELESPESDPEPLRRLEASTGGSLVSADDPAAISSIFDEIAGALVSRYQLRFYSAAAGPTDIAIDVTSSGISAGAALSVQLPETPVFSPETVRPPVEVEPSPPPPEPVVVEVVDPGLLGRRELVVFGGALFFAGLWGVIRLAQVPAERRRPLWKAPSGDKSLSGFAARATSFAERQLGKAERGRGLAVSLERAGSSMRAGEYVVTTVSMAMVAAAFGLFFGGELAALAAGIGTVVASVAVLQFRVQRRQRAFADQLGDALLLIAGSLQAGHGIIQACGAVASEEMEPASEEFQRLIAETRLGRDFTDALRALGDRVGGEDFRWVVDAIDIHREVGGDLSEVLRSLAATIRSRNQVRRRVQALSAEGRMSGVVLMALPFVVAALVTASNPDYLNELFTTRAGLTMVGGAGGLMVAGGLWIRRIVSFDY
jgi:tight adherence protein B